MNLRQIHKILVSSRFTVPAFVIVVIIMRLLFNPAWYDVKFWITLAIQIGMSLFLLQVNHTFTVIRTKTLLPSVFYLLFTGSSPLFYNAFEGTIAAFGVLICLIFLLDTYQNPESQLNALNISLVLVLSSLLWRPLMFFFPFIWYGLYRFRSFNYKTFTATILGLIVVYLFIFAWSLYKDNLQLFIDFLPVANDLLVFYPFSFSLQDWVVIGFLSVLIILSGFNIYVSGISEKIRTGTFLHYFYVMIIGVTILMLAQSEWKANWALILYLPVSLILSHYFTLSTRKITVWLLLLCIVLFFGMYIWQMLEIVTA